MTNLRAGIKFYYFTNDLTSPIEVGSSSEIVEFQNINQPLKNRIVASGDQNVYKLLWSSATSTEPVLRWGLSSGEYTHSMNATTSVISNSSLCGAPATTVGWRDLGLIHTANISGIVDLQLSSQRIYYVFGDAATGDFSSEFVFFVPPLPGTQPPTRPTTVVLMADLGVGSTDTSYDTNIWLEACPPAINTTMSVGSLVAKGLVDAVFHSGDISYADGYLASWDFFLDMITPMAGSAVYLTTVGNHESDYPDTASIYSSTASGGECGVCATELLPMPAPATTNEPWWSYDVGIVHFVGMSTEHNYTTNSRQYLWLENDLKSVNRTLTPWVIFSGHRSMYVDSSYCCPGYDDDDCAVCTSESDVGVMQMMQASIEPMLHKYKVNLAFAGHFHDVQRQSAVYQNQVVQAATYVTDEQGNRVAYHDCPNATVWMVVGSAGNGPDFASENYTWSERYWDRLFGYAVVSAVNATTLSWQFVDSGSDQVVDRMVLTQQPGASWVDDSVPASDSGGGSSSAQGWYSYSYGTQVAMLSVVIGMGLLLFAVLYKTWGLPFIMSKITHDPDLARSNRKTAMRESEMA